MKNKKGFTLIEVLVVVVILAILTILVLPNLMDTFNESKKNSFTNEIRTLYSATESGWVEDFKNNKTDIVYAKTSEGACEHSLKLTGRSNVNYYIKVDKKGLIIEYYAEDGTYQYTYFGEGLKKEQIQNALEVTKITNNQRVKITCDGVILPEAGSSKLTIKPNGGVWNGFSEDKTFTQLPGTTKRVEDPASPVTFLITYNDNGQGATFVSSPASTRGPFTGWTVEGGIFNEETKRYTFTTEDGSLTANYNVTPITLPDITKFEHVCKWAEGSASGTEYAGGTQRTLTKDTTYYAKCVINKYTLTVNPNGGVWNGSSNTQTFTQDYGSTKTINNPTFNYTVTYNANSQEATYTANPTSVTKPFTRWALTGAGSFGGTTYTYGSGNGALTAQYGDATFTLPAITKTGYTCKWAEGSASGTQHEGNTSVTINANTTYYAVCTINQYTLTVKPNGGTWNGKTIDSTITQNYNTTYTVANPSAGPSYIISYNMNSTGITAPTSPVIVQRSFTSWTKSGSGSLSGTTYTFGAGNGTLTANYNTTSNTFVLPAISKTGYTCKWAEGSTSGTQYNGGTSRTITGNTTYYAMCTVNSYKLTVKPNGGTWNSSTSDQEFTQNYGTTKTIANPSAGPTYTITYNANSQGATYTASPTSVQRPFTSWTKSGSGTLSGTTYTYGAGPGTLTANYNTTSSSFTLPTITKTGYTCKWAEGSASGTQYNGGTNRTITANTTYYVVCTINSYTLTVAPSGGTWSGSTSNQTFTQNYNTTKTIANPTAGPTYTITYNANSQGSTYTASPTSVQRPFTSWTKTGSGSISGTTYTFGAGNGTLTATYNTTSSSFTLPTITKTGYTCKWAEGSASGTQYNGGTNRTITANTTYYAVCTINQYTLTVNPNGGTWNGSTSNQTFTQNYATTKTIANPTAGPTYTISYNANSQGSTYTASPTTVQRPFTSWTKTGSGSISGTTYTYGAGAGTLTANYNTTSTSFTLPTITKTGYTCKWAEGSTSGTQYAGGTSRTITANTTYYAVCTINSYTLTVNPNGGTWSGSTSNQTFTQNYNTTKTIANPTAGPTYTISYNANSQGATYTASPTSVQRPFTSWTRSGSGSISGTTYTFGPGNGTLTATYNSTSNSFTLPTITKTGYNCNWAQGSASGTQYAGGSSRTITGNTTFYAVCTIKSTSLTVQPNGGSWSGSTSNQTFTQNYNTTKTIAAPTATPTYTIGYNANSQGATYTGSPTSVTRAFTGWTHSGSGSWASSTNTYTFGDSNGTLTAGYNGTSNAFTLPAISKTGYTCKWAEGSTSGTQYAGGSSRTITANKTYYAICTINSYTLTINPNGGTWGGKTTNSTVTQNYNTTYTVVAPSSGPTYTITYNANSQGATYTGSPTSVSKPFSSWTKSGTGTLSGTTFTFGAGNGTLTASYGNATITLPAISKTGYTCKWAEGSTSGTQYTGGTSRTITANTTYYAVCTVNQYTLTVAPNGGSWSGSTSNQTFTQNYGTTKTIANPTGQSFTITYNANSQGATYTGSPTSVTKPFSSWTKSGTGTLSGTTFTFGAGNGTLTASYGNASLTLPAISKTGYTCKWAEGSTSGAQYTGGTSRTITANTTYYAVCTINQYTLTVNPNGGSWSGSTSNQTFTQNYNTTKTIANPTGAAYTITYNANGQGATYTGSPTSVNKAFSSWSKSGTGTLSGTTFTFGAGNGTLTASYSNTSNSFTLPSITKSGSICKWAEGSASGTQYAGGTSRTITGNTTYYAICKTSYTLSLNPGSGKINGSSSTITVNGTQGETYTLPTPTGGPSYTVSYNANGQGATYTASPTSTTAPFYSWVNNYTGSYPTFGSVSGSTYTFGNGNDTLTASYGTVVQVPMPNINIPSMNEACGSVPPEAAEQCAAQYQAALAQLSEQFGNCSNGYCYSFVSYGSLTLPTITKDGYTCKWAEGSSSGTLHSGGSNTRISENTSYYASCERLPGQATTKIAVDAGSNYMYYMYNGSLYRGKYNTTTDRLNTTLMTSNIDAGSAIAVDDTSSNYMYYMYNGSLYRGTYNTTTNRLTTTLMTSNIDAGSAIAVDDGSLYMYYIYNGSLYRGKYNTTTNRLTTTLMTSNIDAGSKIAVDETSTYMYYMYNGSLYRGKYNTTTNKLTTTLMTSNIDAGSAIAVDADSTYMYYMYNGSLYRGKYNTTTNKLNTTLMTENIDSGSSIAVDGSSTYMYYIYYSKLYRGKYNTTTNNLNSTLMTANID